MQYKVNALVTGLKPMVPVSVFTVSAKSKAGASKKALKIVAPKAAEIAGTDGVVEIHLTVWQ